MKDLYELNKLVERYSNSLQGVYSISDLKNLFNESNEVLLYRKIKKLEEKNILSRFTRGFYTTKDLNLEMLSSRLNKDSYISFGNILAKELLIGSIPQKRISCVKLGKNREYSNKQGIIRFFSIAPHLFFGFTTKGGINYANKEKALLDTLYFYQKGIKFSFNVFEDVDYKSINNEIVMQYITAYNNPKFIQFVKGVLNERF